MHNAVKEDAVSAGKPVADKQQIEQFFHEAFMQAFNKTGIKPQDFSWFSSEPQVNKFK